LPPDFRYSSMARDRCLKTSRVGDGEPFPRSVRFIEVRSKKMNTGKAIRVLSVDDHPLLSEGIATLINNQPDMTMVASAPSGREGILRYREPQPDVTLMDRRLSA